MNSKDSQKRLIPGLLPGDMNVEFFTDRLSSKSYFIQNGKTRVIDKLPHGIKSKIYTMLVNDPVAYEDLKSYTLSEALNQYVMCMFGKLNIIPDIIDGEIQTSEIFTCDPGCRCSKWKSKSIGIEKYGLTKKEKEVLSYLLQESPDKVIADKLNISTNTLSTHKMSVFRKLSVHTRRQLQNLVGNF